MSRATSDQDYYENKEHWGEGAFVTLENIIDNIILTASHDSYFKKLERHRASIFGKLGIKKLNVDIKSKDKAITIQLPPSKIFAFPRYMQNWKRISVINKCDKLTELGLNSGSISIQDYLQDHEWELLYDDEGNVLRANDFSAEHGHCKKIIQCDDINLDCGCGCTDDTFKDSWVKENKEGHYFEFSDELVDELIVFEFSTSGLDTIKDCDILVHNQLEETLTYFIKWKLTEGTRNTPRTEVLYFKEMFRVEKNRSKYLLANKITVAQILESISLKYN